ncbi:MAG: phosphoribosylformylglycinamidine synthase I [Chloroflexi bacterium]|nr:MAG: phosphoribosylformylglycinamidine synthase I [Chloroflexota bacterium]
MAVVVFPGTWSDRDFLDVADSLGWAARAVWHTETRLDAIDAVALPGGFAHGDHLRAGAIARFSPVMRAVSDFAAQGGPVIGSCNGFQILSEAGLLPGALLRNDHLEFRCAWQWLRVDAATGPFLGTMRDADLIRLPISHGEGRYYADEATLDDLEASGRVVLRYTDADGRAVAEANPNGSMRSIAGIVNERGNILGLMPHPERAADPETGGTDGLAFFRALDAWLARQPARAERRL